MSSAATTNLSGRLMLTVLMLGLIALIYLAMRRGWQRQARSQQEIPVPKPVGASVGKYSGIYASTTLAGQPLKRVVVHGLGSRSKVSVALTNSSVELHRQAAPSFSIPKSDLIAVSRASAIAGKVVGDNGLVLITWRLGDTEVDTGLLIRDEEFVAQIAELL